MLAFVLRACVPRATCATPLLAAQHLEFVPVRKSVYAAPRLVATHAHSYVRCGSACFEGIVLGAGHMAS